MSIISEALNKANAERRGSQTPRRSGSASPVRTWLSSLIVLAIMVLPFALPRILNRAAAHDPAAEAVSAAVAPSAAEALPDSLPMADTPAAGAGSSGLAQISVETQPIPAPMFAAADPPAFQPITRRLQGVAWTQNKGYYAILDDHVVREGSLVGQMRVTRITPSGVTLTNGTENFVIEKSF